MAAVTKSYRRLDRSLRFGFRFDHGVFTLFDRRELEMIPLPSQDTRPFDPAERSGCWIEVQDRGGQTVYRRGLTDPRVRRSEAADDEHGRMVMWVAEHATFSVVVPNAARGADLVIFASSIEKLGTSGPAAEILRVPLREERDPPVQPRTMTNN